MAERKRIGVSLPVSLLNEIDRLVGSGKVPRSRSQLFLEAVKFYLGELHRRQFEEALRSGYEQMGQINLSLSQEGYVAETEALLMAAGWESEGD